jgi:hypothetical protein
LLEAVTASVSLVIIYYTKLPDALGIGECIVQRASADRLSTRDLLRAEEAPVAVPVTLPAAEAEAALRIVPAETRDVTIAVDPGRRS